MHVIAVSGCFRLGVNAYRVCVTGMAVVSTHQIPRILHSPSRIASVAARDHDYTSSTWHADRTRCFIVSYMFPKRAVYCPILSSIDKTSGSCGQSRLVQLWLRRQTKQVTRTARVVMLASANNAAVYYIGVVRRTGFSAPTCKNVTRSLSVQCRLNCFNFICNQQSKYILLRKLIVQSITYPSTFKMKYYLNIYTLD